MYLETPSDPHLALFFYFFQSLGRQKRRDAHPCRLIHAVTPREDLFVKTQIGKGGRKTYALLKSCCHQGIFSIPFGRFIRQLTVTGPHDNSLNLCTVVGKIPVFFCGEKFPAFFKTDAMLL